MPTRRGRKKNNSRQLHLFVKVTSLDPLRLQEAEICIAAVVTQSVVWMRCIYRQRKVLSVLGVRFMSPFEGVHGEPLVAIAWTLGLLA